MNRKESAGIQEGLEMVAHTTTLSSHDQKRLIPAEPKLRYINRTLQLLQPETDEGGNVLQWTRLHTQVGPYENVLELTDKVREIIRQFLENKIPSLKENIPSIEDLPNKKLLEALAHNYFEEIDETEGQRRKVLLAVMAHITRRIETHTYQRLLEEANDTDLEKLSLKPSTRDLLVKLMDIAVKANPLFIRFLAFSQLSGKPPKQASPTSLFLPGDHKPHTIAELFPHETQWIAHRLAALAKDSKHWINEKDGIMFQKYLMALSRYYAERDPEKVSENQTEIDNLQKELLSSHFPILLIAGTGEGYTKEPYSDPELKIALASSDSQEEEVACSKAQEAMADSFISLGVARFSENLRKKKIRVANVLGGYGVNLTFNAVAEEMPEICLYLNEQIRAYDRDFPIFMQNYIHFDREFDDLGEEERTAIMQRMSRTNTLLHEFAHSVYPDESEEAKKLGRRPLTVIDEVKAEIVHKALVPKILEKDGLPGSQDQWGLALLASSCQMLKDQPEDDPYHAATVYSLNDLFQGGAIALEGEKIRIRDYERYFQILESQAREVLSLYGDEKMTEGKARAWIQRRCTPNKLVKKLERILKIA